MAKVSKQDCTRCESVGREPGAGIKPAIGPNGIVSLVCDTCWEEIEYFVYEDQENEAIS